MGRAPQSLLLLGGGVLITCAVLPVTIASTEFVAVRGSFNNMCCVAGDDSIHRVCCC